MEQVKIREAVSDDLTAILGLYDDMLDGDIKAGSERMEEAWRSVMESDHFVMFILEAEGRPASTCMLAVVPNLTRGARPFGVIENVVTAANRRGRGYGGRVVRHAMESAWKRGCYKVMLMTGRRDERVFRFYERTGLRRDIKQAFAAYAEDLKK